MSVFELLHHDWSANPVVLVCLTAATVGYAVVVRRRGRWAFFAAAVALTAFTLLSPLDFLAQGVLFSAHMAQHIALLLLVPALVLLSLPAPAGKTSVAQSPLADERGSRAGRGGRGAGKPPANSVVVLCWMLGVGSMWFWHVPQCCDAAAGSVSIHALQTVSLLAMGAAFWWPILAPSPAQRVAPGIGIGYLFTACLACTALGILLTLTPIEVCPIFRTAPPVASPWDGLRDVVGAARDQKIGGLLMWLPMCLVYVAGIILELARWFGESPETKPVPNLARS